MHKPISIYLVDDHKIFSQSFQVYISSQTNFVWKGSSEGDSNTTKEILFLKPDIILLDFHLKNINGLELLKKLRDSNYKGLIVLLTMNREMEINIATKNLGGNGFINKEVDAEELLLGLEQLFKGEKDYLELSKFTSPKINPYHLTSQENIIAELVCSGISSADISKKLNISIHTVHTHRRRVLEKTNSSNFNEVRRKLL